MSSIRWVYRILLVLVLSSSIGWAKKGKGHRKKTPSLKQQFHYSFSDIQDYLVVVEHRKAVGSGFIVKMGDRYYILTNQHVIMGADTICFKTISGKILQPKMIELAEERDIARLFIESDAGFEISDHPKVDAPIAVFGNSDGAGVATELFGKIKKVTDDLVEVSAEFVSGNSGSPVLDKNKKVIAIASYVRFLDQKKSKKGKKQKLVVQRFCYRLTGTKWRHVDWKKYNKKYGKAYLKNEKLIDNIFEIAQLWYLKPFGTFPSKEYTSLDLKKWAKNHNQMVNRVNRIMKKGAITQHELDNTNKQIRKDLMDSVEAFSDVCKSHARKMRFFSNQKELTGFLRKSFLRLAVRLEMTSKNLDEFKQSLTKFNFFRFR